MKRILVSLIIILTQLVWILPVNAQASSSVKVGDKLVLKGGYEAVCVGFTNSGKPKYETDLSTPKYLPDLVTPIDTTWHIDENGDYTNGADKFHSYVSDGFVSISDKVSKSMSWQPNISVKSNVIGKLDQKGSMKLDQIDKSVQLNTVDNSKPTLLDIDPLNANYKNNTLEWDLGNGIYRRLRLIEGMQQEYYYISEPLTGDFTITQNLTEQGISSLKGVAWDADNKLVQLTEDNDHNITLSLDDVSSATYPIIIDPDTTFTTSASDGYLGKYFITDYSTTRTAASSDNATYSSYDLLVQNTKNGEIDRACLYFDTSSLSGYTVYTGYLNIYVHNGLGYNTNSESIQIQSGMPTYPHDPLQVGDYNLSNYAGNGGSIPNADGLTGYKTINLNSSGIAMINTSGTTKFCLRTTGDINNIAPTGVNGLVFYAYEAGSGYCPKLVVTIVPTSVAIVSKPVSNPSSTTARLNSLITDDGNDTTVQVRFGYGTTTEAAVDFESYDTVTAWVDGYHKNNTPYIDVIDLVPSTPYYYRVQAKNSVGTVTSVDEQSFTPASAALGDVIGFYGFPSSTSITLTWSIGAGGTNVYIRYSKDTYPATISDGDLVYHGSNSGYVHTGLSKGTTYYYSAWTESGGTYSTNAVNLAMTTKIIGEGDVLTTPTTSSNWNQAPNPTFLTNLQPFYAIFNNVVDDWGIPRGTAWTGLFLFIDMLIGIFLYIRFHAPALALIVAAMFMAFGVTVHILPEIFIVLSIILALGGWASRPTYNV